MRKLYCLISLCCVIISCDNNPEVADRSLIEWQDVEKELQTAFIQANDGDTISIPSGYFHFKKSLLMDAKKHIVVKGAGMKKTVLSFKGQEEGAEGIKISYCEDITLEGFTVEDAAGDNIKVTDTDGITFRRVKAQWTGPVSESNGAYALYPVLCKNVLIEECVAIGSSDAGIYVGQSDSVIIRNNEASRNVAGIESENSNYVEIYGNKAINNTGGILVFDLPGLTQYGAHIKVHDNLIQENNHRNFAPEGNIVGVVPPGTGLMLLATRNVEVYNNHMLDNRTVATAIISYELVAAISEENEPLGDEKDEGSAQRINSNYELDAAYNPFPEAIVMRDNTIENSKWFATFAHDFGMLFNWKFPFNPPDIVFDGFIKEGQKPADVLCLKENDAFTFVNLDAPNDLEDLNENKTPFVCSL